MEYYRTLALVYVWGLLEAECMARYGHLPSPEFDKAFYQELEQVLDKFATDMLNESETVEKDMEAYRKSIRSKLEETN